MAVSDASAPGSIDRSGEAAARAPKDTAERIVSAALDCLAEDPDVGMADIAARAGVGRATLYRRYPNRAALIAAIQARAMADAGRVLHDSRLEEGAAGEALERVIVGLAGVIERYRVIARGEKDDGSEHEGKERIRTAVVRLVQRGQREGEFAGDIPADLAAEMLRGMVMAACSHHDPRVAGLHAARVARHGLAASAGPPPMAG